MENLDPDRKYQFRVIPTHAEGGTGNKSIPSAPFTTGARGGGGGGGGGGRATGGRREKEAGFRIALGNVRAPLRFERKKRAALRSEKKRTALRSEKSACGITLFLEFGLT